MDARERALVDASAALRDVLLKIPLRSLPDVLRGEPVYAWLAALSRYPQDECPCGHPASSHRCREPGCKRGCHDHDGSDGPCDCLVKLPQDEAQPEPAKAAPWGWLEEKRAMVEASFPRQEPEAKPLPLGHEYENYHEADGIDCTLAGLCHYPQYDNARLRKCGQPRSAHAPEVIDIMQKMVEAGVVKPKAPEGGKGER